MNRSIKWIIAVGLAASGAGCGPSYEREPVDQLHAGDTGLQSKDVVNASDKMAADILANKFINARKDQLVIVVDHMDNKTLDASFPTDIFLTRLKAKLSELGEGRITLVENRDKLHDLQSKELEQNGTDDFGQGGGRAAPGPAGLQPDYSLNGTITELGNGATSYFSCEFTILGLKGPDARRIIFDRTYEVSTPR